MKSRRQSLAFGFFVASSECIMEMEDWSNGGMGDGEMQVAALGVGFPNT